MGNLSDYLFYSEPGITLYCGDCREVLPLLKDSRCTSCCFEECHGMCIYDLLLTDPPYGIGKAEWDTDFATEWMLPASRLCRAIAVMPGIWNVLKLPDRVGDLEYKWMIAAHLINGMTNGAIGYGNFIPCLVYVREGFSVHASSSDIADIVVGREKMPDHPCPKPLDAMRWFVSRLNATAIIDPFSGSGTTLLAAKEQGRRAIGIEIEPKYCEIAVKRLRQEVLPL